MRELLKVGLNPQPVDIAIFLHVSSDMAGKCSLRECIRCYIWRFGFNSCWTELHVICMTYLACKRLEIKALFMYPGAKNFMAFLSTIDDNKKGY